MFAYLGYLAHITGQNITDVVSEGKKLVIFCIKNIFNI